MAFLFPAIEPSQGTGKSPPTFKLSFKRKPTSKTGLELACLLSLIRWAFPMFAEPHLPQDLELNSLSSKTTILMICLLNCGCFPIFVFFFFHNIQQSLLLGSFVFILFFSLPVSLSLPSSSLFRVFSVISVFVEKSDVYQTPCVSRHSRQMLI